MQIYAHNRLIRAALNCGGKMWHVNGRKVKNVWCNEAIDFIW